MNAAALVCRQLRLVSTTPLACPAGSLRPRCSDRLLGQRICLERIRIAALDDTNRFLTAALCGSR